MSLDHADSAFIAQEGIELLVACGQRDRAIAVCREYLDRSDIDDVEKMEAFGKLGEEGSTEAAHELIIGLLERENCEVAARATGATMLYRVEFSAKARAILFALAKEEHDIDEALWVADAMISCDLPWTAQDILKSIDQRKLDDQNRTWFADLQANSNPIPPPSATRQ